VRSCLVIKVNAYNETGYIPIPAANCRNFSASPCRTRNDTLTLEDSVCIETEDDL